MNDSKLDTSKEGFSDSQEPFFGYTLSVISGKWKLLIIYHLSKNGTVRYNELQRMLGKITYKTLSSTLKEMQNDGLVFRKEYPQIPPKVEYSLTEKGQTLWPLIQGMCHWGEQNQEN
ncbi:helix-turn-helix transcriptional regulator [Lysinibacillus sp. OL1_EC]|uniref:winged helix-turn-helix transcriptional regulator n=1 Tax=unclassified Lysinibacillus TaxID=2636778 RepID=UPI0010405749|nr:MULTISPECIES: helix-turn-helix domain-containing protein [unclassified Lysinibacillus]MCM0624499.1 helix-turn-helix transcriptional regulator [Lysinibacillus sp. OL1_EC]TBV88233.1 transcriptional regulator [Lysinibacillus sp. OL1]